MFGVLEDGKVLVSMEERSNSVSDLLSPGLAESCNALIFFLIFKNIVNFRVGIYLCFAGVVVFEIDGL